MHWSRQLHQTTQWHHITLERVFALSQPPKFWLFFLFACIKISVRKNYLMQHVKNPVLPWPGDGTKHYWWMVHKKGKVRRLQEQKNRWKNVAEFLKKVKQLSWKGNSENLSVGGNRSQVLWNARHTHILIPAPVQWHQPKQGGFCECIVAFHFEMLDMYRGLNL